MLEFSRAQLTIICNVLYLHGFLTVGLQQNFGSCVVGWNEPVKIISNKKTKSLCIFLISCNTHNAWLLIRYPSAGVAWAVGVEVRGVVDTNKDFSFDTHNALRYVIVQVAWAEWVGVRGVGGEHIYCNR